MTDTVTPGTRASLVIVTTRFGADEEVPVAPSDLYTFPEALPGLPDSHRYALVIDPSYAPMRWLQSLDEPLVCLPVLPLSGLALEGYADDAAEGAGLSMHEVGEQVMVVTRYDRQALTFVSNLLAPIVLEPTTATGRQIVLDGHNYPLRQAIQWNAIRRVFGVPC